MKRKALVYVAAAVLSAGGVIGCSSGPDVCPTDGFTAWAQQQYYIGPDPCFMDGHNVWMPGAAYNGSYPMQSASVNANANANANVNVQAQANVNAAH